VWSDSNHAANVGSSDAKAFGGIARDSGEVACASRHSEASLASQMILGSFLT
jgi:hypothetical protein